jgi:hypothetical protein
MAATSSPLLDFLTRLNDDDELRRRFDEDLEALLAEESLSDAAKDALRSRDQAKLDAALAADGVDSATAPSAWGPPKKKGDH